MSDNTNTDKQPRPPSHASFNTAEEQTTQIRASLQSVTDSQLFSAGFWDRDPRTVIIRRTYVTTLFRGTLLTAVIILALLSIYWGAFWKIEDNLHHLNAWVVDFDSGAIGKAVQGAAINSTGPLDRLSWSIIPASQFPNGPPDVIQAVLDEKCWVAIVVNPNATARLDSAVSSVDASYDGSSAVTIYAVEARNENSYSTITAPLTQAVINLAISSFTPQHVRGLASYPNVTVLLATAPNVITRPLSFTLDNLRPFDVTAANAADFVGLIYLLIISFLLTVSVGQKVSAVELTDPYSSQNLNFAARMESGLDHHLSLRSLISVRLMAPITMYFFLSLVFSLLSLAFQIPFDRRFGHSGFVIFWILNWMAMCALGLALEAVVTLLTPRFAPYFMILWIIIDVSVSFYPIEILPGVFRYGYATPFYNVSRAVRTIIFSTRNQVGLNFGVEFAWIAISLMTMPLFQWYKRRSAVREWQIKHASEKTL